MTSQPPHHAPEPMHDLVTTVAAPACAFGERDGQIRPHGVQGLYVSDWRVLRTAHLRIGGRNPVGLGWFPHGPGRTSFDAVAPGLGDDSPDPTVRLSRLRTVRADGMEETIRILSTAIEPVRVEVTLDLAPDRTSLPVARRGESGDPITAGIARLDSVGTGAGPGSDPNALDSVLAWSEDGVTVTVRAPGARARPGGWTWPIELAHGEHITLRWSLRVSGSVPSFVPAPTELPWSRPEIDAADPRLARLVGRALDDLDSLRLAEASSPADVFVAAGAPWFMTLFGRDAIWAARMLLPLGTDLASSTLRALARRQGTGVNIETGEEPGKIMHELRQPDNAPMQVRGDAGGPWVYYGTVDATPLWISLLADAWRWGLAEESVVRLLPHLRRALTWIADYGDQSGSGFLCYVDRSGRGLANQGWKDSGTSVRFRDGRTAAPPIALCEVQGYAHRAALDAAALLDAYGEGPGEAERWREYADQLAERFRARFWVDGTYGPQPALALDGDGRPVDSLTSNIGHLLGTGLLRAAEETQVARLLGSPALAGGFGLRTMSDRDAAYDPLSYHNGSIWPHDTAITLLGLAGMRSDPAARQASEQLIDGLLAAAETFDFRLPELYSGDARDEVSRPLAHPAACRPQAWSAAAGVALLQAVLGLAAVDGTVTASPLLPGPASVRGLRFGGKQLDITIDPSGAGMVTAPVWRPVGPRARPSDASEPVRHLGAPHA